MLVAVLLILLRHCGLNFGNPGMADRRVFSAVGLPPSHIRKLKLLMFHTKVCVASGTITTTSRQEGAMRWQ